MGPKPATIEHTTLSLDPEITSGLLQVRNINLHFNHDEHRREKREYHAKVKKFAIDKLGYNETYMSPKDSRENEAH